MSVALVVFVVISIITKVVECREKCRDYFDTKGYYRTTTFCDEGSFCCGDCLNRYCCTNSDDRLEEEFCRNLFNYDLLVNTVILFVGVILFKIIFIGFICLCHVNTKSSKQVRPLNSSQNEPMAYNDAIKNSIKVENETTPPPYPGVAVIQLT